MRAGISENEMNDINYGEILDTPDDFSILGHTITLISEDDKFINTDFKQYSPHLKKINLTSTDVIDFESFISKKNFSKPRLLIYLYDCGPFRETTMFFENFLEYYVINGSKRCLNNTTNRSKTSFIYAFYSNSTFVDYTNKIETSIIEEIQSRHNETLQTYLENKLLKIASIARIKQDIYKLIMNYNIKLDKENIDKRIINKLNEFELDELITIESGKQCMLFLIIENKHFKNKLFQILNYRYKNVKITQLIDYEHIISAIVSEFDFRYLYDYYLYELSVIKENEEYDRYHIVQEFKFFIDIQYALDKKKYTELEFENNKSTDGLNLNNIDKEINVSDIYEWYENNDESLDKKSSEEILDLIDSIRGKFEYTNIISKIDVPITSVEDTEKEWLRYKKENQN